jgi:pimeloyl-ACP methyl ester carboxylesterase
MDPALAGDFVMKLTWMQTSIVVSLFCLAFAGYWGYQQILLKNLLEQDLVKEQESYQLIQKHCWFTVDWQKSVKCFHLKTPQSTGEFYLPVVIIKDDSIDHQSDPVVYLQGGPGLGAALDQEGMDKWMNWLIVARLNRDLILMDARGTGLSLPKLNCSDNGKQAALWKENISLVDELKINNQSMLDCFDSLQKHNLALSVNNFSTQYSARDVVNLMQKLNYQQWNILGVSYGTRLALEIEQQLKTLPAPGLKAMVLDSLYPAGYGGVQTWPQVLDSAMSGFFDGCMQQIDCKRLIKNSGQLKEELVIALQKLKSNPIDMTIKRWDGEAPIYFVVNDHRFVSAIFAAIYDARDWPDIVNAIHAVNQQSGLVQEQQLKKLIEPYLNRNLNSHFNSLAFTAVDCADNAMGLEQDYLQSLIDFPLMAEYTKDQWQYQLCHQLSAKHYLQLHAPTIPTLILSGKNDPVTPSTWAVAMHQEWKNSQLILRENLAHSVLSTDICLLENLHRFFDEPGKEFDYCEGK